MYKDGFIYERKTEVFFFMGFCHVITFDIHSGRGKCLI